MSTPVISDPCARKHGGNENSIEANQVVDKESDRAWILELIRAVPVTGKTLDELCWQTGKPANTLSGRLCELHAKGLIYRDGTKRPTRSGSPAKVWRAVQ